ncbi:MAG: chorismate-binding protein, partial [Myxococcota bacterium]
MRTTQRPDETTYEAVAADGTRLRARLIPRPAPSPDRLLGHVQPGDRPFALVSGRGDPSLTRWSYGALEACSPHLDFITAFDATRGHLGVRSLPDDWPPFTGGAVGYLSYDEGWRWAARPRPPRPQPLGLPPERFHRYDALYARNERTGSGLVIWEARPDAARRARRIEQALLRPERRLRGQLVGGASKLHPRVDRASHEARISSALRLIAEGEIYQVNLTYALEGRFRGHPGAALQRLVQDGAPPFSAYLGVDDEAHVVSASPECFLELNADGRLRTFPIKGTHRRAPAPDRDVALAAALRADPKERAEHLMIVDLLRNDLGRVARPGTVEVPSLAYVESFPTVHHLTTTIEADLDPMRTGAEVLAATFPGGSITGAPKQAAMEVIDALEDEARGLYTGALAWIDRGGALRASIAIRTAEVHQGALRFGVGGGIVADSVPAREW